MPSRSRLFTHNQVYLTQINGRVVRSEWDINNNLVAAEYVQPQAHQSVSSLRQFKIRRFIWHRGGDTQGKYAPGEKAELERKVEADATKLLEHF